MYFYRTYRDERERGQGKATRAPSTYTTLGRKGGEARAGGGARGCVRLTSTACAPARAAARHVRTPARPHATSAACPASAGRPHATSASRRL